MKPIFECKVPGNLDTLVTYMMTRPDDECFQVQVFNNSIEVYRLKAKECRFTRAYEYLMFSGTTNFLEQSGMLNSLARYLTGEIDLEKLGMNLLTLALRNGVADRTLSLAEESDLIRTGKITGSPRFESMNDHFVPGTSDQMAELVERIKQEDLDVLPLPEEEIPVTYTSAEVIEIIKMIRPDIADVQTVLDKLLFKP